MLSDLRYAFRQFARAPAFTSLSAVILGAGIGLNVSLFSVFDQLVLRPPAARDLDQLVVALEADAANPGRGKPVFPADFASWQSQVRNVVQWGAYETRSAQCGSDENPRAVRLGLVTSGYFPLLGVAPALGRTFAPDEETAGASARAPVVLSHAFWQRACNADPAILGQTIRLDRVEHQVIGVMPPDFGLPRGTELWQPKQFTPAELSPGAARTLTVFGRMRPGVSLTQVKSELQAVMLGLHPPGETRSAPVMFVAPARSWAVEEVVRRFSLLLLGAAGFVLAAACANAGNLQIARSLGRRGEFAVRRALGASRWALVRQALAEGALQSVFATSVGILLSFWLLALVQTRLPAEVGASVAGWSGLHIDGRALGLAVALGVASSVMSALFPALGLSSSRINGSLRENLSGMSFGPRRHAARNLLAAAQVALTLVLLGGATMLIDGFARRAKVSADLAPGTLLALQPDLPRGQLTDAQVRETVETLRGRLAALPQIEAAALVTAIPFLRHGSGRFEPFRAREAFAGATGEEPYAMAQAVSDDYFRTLKTRLLTGRHFNPADGASGPPVVIISESVARLLATTSGIDTSPIGRLIQLGSADPARPWLMVIGVVSDVPHFAIQPDPPYTCYLPLAQTVRPVTKLMLRTRLPADKVQPLVATELARLIPDRAHSVRTMDQVIAGEMAALAYLSSLLTAFATISALFSIAGVYGLMTWMVHERTREIGVRIALGAAGDDVVSLLVRSGLRIAGNGIVLGLLGATGLSLFLSRFIAGAASANPLLLALLALALFGAITAACWLPARRAARINPIIALRAE